MYAICSTKRNDVKDAVKAAIKKGYISRGNTSLKMFQVSPRKYNRLQDNREAAQTHVNTTNTPHNVNYKTMRIHTDDCAHAGENVVKAHIINAHASGLYKCKHCM